MDNFNYQEYLRNNPLLKEKVKDQLITESQEVEEVEIPSASLTKINADVKNAKTMAQAILDFIEQVKEKETVDFGTNATMKIVLDKLNTLAKTEDKEEVAEAEEIQEEVPSSKMKVSELKAKIKEDIMSLLQEEEEVDVDIDVEDEVEVDAEADDIEIERKGTKAKVEVGLSPEEEIVQDSLKAAMDAAEALGSQKLADQIGNTITFFTRQFVVGDNTD